MVTAQYKAANALLVLSSLTVALLLFLY